MASFQMEDNLSDSEEAEFRHTDERTGNVFIIDMSEKMLETQKLITAIENNDNYFKFVLYVLNAITRFKLSINSSDMFGVMLSRIQKDKITDHLHMGDINEANLNDSPENSVFAVNLDAVSVDTYFKLNDINDMDEKLLKEVISTKDECISEAIRFAIDKLNSVKQKMPAKRIILITCDDNPAVNNKVEQNKIRQLADSLKTLNIQFEIIGLSDDWNEQLFYTDVKLLANVYKGKNQDIFEVLQQIINRSQTVASFNLRFTDEFSLPVSVKSLVTQSRYLKKIQLDRRTNEPLKTITNYYKLDPVTREKELVEAYDGITGYKIGDKICAFSKSERRQIKQTTEFGMDLLYFTEVEDSFVYISAPQLLTISENASSEEKQCFYALLVSLDIDFSMAVCSGTLRADSATCLYLLQPNIPYKGFYMQKIPYNEDVRSQVIKKTIGADVNKNQLNLMKKIVNALKISSFNPTLYTNPRHKRMIDLVEHVALNVTETKEIKDETLPNDEQKLEALNSLSDNDIFEEFDLLFKKSAAKKRKTDNSQKHKKDDVASKNQKLNPLDRDSDNDNDDDDDDITSDLLPKKFRHSTKKLPPEYTQEEAENILLRTQLEYHNNDILRKLCRFYQLPTNGTKLDLLTRLKSQCQSIKARSNFVSTSRG